MWNTNKVDESSRYRVHKITWQSNVNKCTNETAAWLAALLVEILTNGSALVHGSNNPLKVSKAEKLQEVVRIKLVENY